MLPSSITRSTPPSWSRMSPIVRATGWDWRYSATSFIASSNRRSLIFLFTDLNDPQLAANLAEVLPVASRRHVIVVISMRDPLLDQVAGGPAKDRRGVYQAIAARQLAMERATRTRELKR